MVFRKENNNLLSPQTEKTYHLRSRSDSPLKPRKPKSIRASKLKFGYWRNSEQVKYLEFVKANFLLLKNA